MLTQKTGPPISFACENFNDNDKQKTKLTETVLFNDKIMQSIS